MDKKLLEVARRSIEAHLDGGRPDFSDLLGGKDRPEATAAKEPQGVFVTLWSPGERLRGCIGRHGRLHERLGDEIADLAVAAAVEDPRFRPVKLEELPGLSIEVSLLEAPERVSGPAELDPHAYGVIVKSGRRQATLLPNIDGIDTVDEQVSVVLRKAGIRPEEPVEFFRFRVRKISE